ncbi:hypothetical protein HDV03_000877 [Kappamyces sp. JEL0829]|nr:hypothetical protein HDV03_000877 [Kappamyces sp. JEL0829]
MKSFDLVLLLLFALHPISAAILPLVSINGNGATFPQLVYSTWMNLYPLAGILRNVNVSFTYTPTSSGTGRQVILDRQVQFGASDGNASQAQWTNTTSGSFRMFPVLASSVAFGYNINGLSATLNMSRENLIRIFQGTVVKWSDPLILSDNPALATFLAGSTPAITSVRRLDSSGTTQIVSTALQSFSNNSAGVTWSIPSFQTYQSWPSIPSPGVAVYETGNAGVAISILTTPFSIGYIEHAIADEYLLTYANLLNRAGYLVRPSVTSVGAAVADFQSVYPTISRNAFYANIVDGGSPASYPIVGFTYMAFLENYPDNSLVITGSGTTMQYELMRFFHWALTDTSAALAASRYNFATAGSNPQLLSIAYEILGNIRYSSDPTVSASMISKVQTDYAAELAVRNRPYCANGCINGICLANNITGIGYCRCTLTTWTGPDCSIKELPLVYTSIGNYPSYWGLVGLSLGCIVLTIASGCVLRLYSKNDMLRASSLDLSYGILGFVLLGHVSAIVGLLLPSQTVCSKLGLVTIDARLFLFPAAITGVLTCFCLKLYRVFFVFGATGSKSRYMEGVGTVYFAWYTAGAVGICCIFSSIWIAVDPYVPVVLRSVDDVNFYTGCSSSGSIVPITMMSLMGLEIAAILGIIIYLSIQLGTVPTKFRAAQFEAENCYVIAFCLTGLLLNQQFVYSEYIKNLVFASLVAFLLQFLHFTMVLSVTIRAILFRASSMPGLDSGSHSQIATVIMEALQERKTTARSEKGVLVGHSCRLPGGFLQHWNDEIIFYNPLNGFMIFESIVAEGTYLAFNVKDPHTRLEVPRAIGDAEHTQLEFSITHNQHKQLVMVKIKPDSDEGRLWIAALRRHTGVKGILISDNPESASLRTSKQVVSMH